MAPQYENLLSKGSSACKRQYQYIADTRVFMPSASIAFVLLAIICLICEREHDLARNNRG